MGRRKTTVYLDSDVLTATKRLAATRGSSENQIIEQALRSYLQSGELEAASSELRNLMERLGQRTTLDEDAAVDLAVSEVRAVRAGNDSTAGS